MTTLMESKRLKPRVLPGGERSPSERRWPQWTAGIAPAGKEQPRRWVVRKDAMILKQSREPAHDRNDAILPCLGFSGQELANLFVPLAGDAKYAGL
jgi:hypothetical protein